MAIPPGLAGAGETRRIPRAVPVFIAQLIGEASARVYAGVPVLMLVIVNGASIASAGSWLLASGQGRASAAGTGSEIAKRS